jgi:hypothetical protein
MRATVMVRGSAPWLLFSVLSCGTDAASPTPRDLDQGGPRLEAAVVNVPSSSWSFQFTPVNSRDNIGPTPWGPFFTYPALVRLVATGSAMAQCIWPNCGPAVGPFKAANAFPYLGIGITVTSSLGTGIGWGVDSDTTYGGGHGAMAALWQTGPGDIHQPYCDQVATPCYNYDGGTISVAVFKPPIQVTFGPDTVTQPSPGHIVQFNVVFSPTTFEGRLMNFGAMRWLFQPDGGTASQVCGITNACSFVPQKSGTLYADVVAQGDSMRFTARVKVPCVTTDTLLNNSAGFRQLLADAINGSNLGATASLRRERGGQVRCIGGTCTFELNPPVPTDTPCSSAQGPDLANGVVIQIHSHPFSPNSINDTLPNNQALCPFQTPLQPGQVYTLAPWPSNDDLRILGSNGLSLGREIAGYIVDRDAIYYVPGMPVGGLPQFSHDTTIINYMRQRYNSLGKTVNRITCDPLAP